jgi:hypothetical protein
MEKNDNAPGNGKPHMQRGVARPQMAGNHEMSHDQRMEMLHMHHMQTLWVYWLLIILGFWMILSPLTFSYGKNIVQPAGGRRVWRVR